MTEFDYPFIYISSLNRTGSTLLSEALTLLPYAFILHEPHLGKNYFALQENDVAQLKTYDVDLPKFVRYRLKLAFMLRRLRWAGYRQDYIICAFRSNILPQMLSQIQQIGVKEIRHMGWQNYVRHFPNMRVVMTGRDPRDIYISMYYKWIKNNSLHWHRPFTPLDVADDLNKEFCYQLELYNATESYCVTYEKLCTDPNIIDEIRSFVQSPIPKIGTIGGFVSTHPKRVNEFELHGNEISVQRVQRWRYETNEELLDQAFELSALMPEYREFWEYDE